MRILALALVGCAHEAAFDPATGLRVVTEASELADGQRVLLEGEVVRAVADEVGTAIALADGTHVFVAFGEPPHGWDGLLGQEVRVVGTVVRDGMVPMLADVDAPMPTSAQ